METPGEILARQIEAECYDLAALEQEALIPPPALPEPTAVVCLHPSEYRRWGAAWCSSCGVFRGRRS